MTFVIRDLFLSKLSFATQNVYNPRLLSATNKRISVGATDQSMEIRFETLHFNWILSFEMYPLDEEKYLPHRLGRTRQHSYHPMTPSILHQIR